MAAGAPPDTDTSFIRAVEAIYGAAVEPASWPDALTAIANCTGDHGAILIHGREDGSFGVIGSRSLQQICVEYARDGWDVRDIRAIRSREKGFFIGRDVITDRDVVTAAEIENSPFYSEFLARHGLKYFAAAMVSPSPGIEVAMSVQRATGKPEYNEQEIEIISRLGKHVEKALRLGIKLLDGELLNLGLAGALSRLSIGTFLLDEGGRVLFVNRAGEGLLGDGLSLSNGRLSIRADSEESGTLLAGEIGAKVEPGTVADLKPVVVQRRDGTRPLVLHFLPIPSGSNVLGDVFLRANMVVLAVDAAKGAPIEASLIRDIMGLTLGEARIASLVGSGMAPRATAERLGISEETARTVLKRVFAKTGVSRQSELSELMSRLLLVQPKSK